MYVPHTHVLSLLLTTVSKPAPDWNGTAVVGNPPEFKDLRLIDFKGTCTHNTDKSRHIIDFRQEQSRHIISFTCPTTPP